MSDLKTKPTKQTAKDFLNSISDAQKRNDSLTLLKIMKRATKKEPVMWGSSIIGFGSYHYKYASGREGDWMMAGFSPRKQNLTVYIMSGFDDYADVSGYNPKPYLKQLGPYTSGKSCLYIKRLSDINQIVLEKLIKTSYEHMKKTNSTTT